MALFEQFGLVKLQGYGTLTPPALTPLEQAILANDYQGLDGLKDLQGLVRSDPSPLILAVTRAEPEFALHLLKAAPIADKIDADLRFKLFWAAVANGRISLVAALIDLGQDPNHQNDFGRTGLYTSFAEQGSGNGCDVDGERC